MAGNANGRPAQGPPAPALTPLGSHADGVVDFVHGLDFSALSAAVVEQAQRCLLDLAATAAGAHETTIARIVRSHVARHYATPSGTRLLLDGRRAIPAWAAMAGGMMIDGFDAHDGHVLTKGHAGVAVLPALLALHDGQPLSGRAMILDLVVGYEVAIRAGIATHRTNADYHTSGAWNALGVAAITARTLRLDAARTRHALGIAEYHGPRSQMMRCIDHPTMLKDGSGWGAMVGITAAQLAADGFTGAPALVVEAAEVKDLWADLGRRWRIMELYFKPYPICRWAQPAVEAVLELRRDHAIDPARVRSVDIATFHEAVRLAARRPGSTEEAQYSLPFPVAAALARGRLGPAEIDKAGLHDGEIARLAAAVRLIEKPEYNARFPAERMADVSITLDDGSRLTSPPTWTRGDPERPLGDSELDAKFRELSIPVVGPARAAAIQSAITGLSEPGSDATRLIDLLVERVG